MKFRVAKRNRRTPRKPAGVYMIELITAIAVSAMLSAALVGAMADTERLSTAGQNQIIAAAIAQEQIDNVRDTLYGSLAPGTYTLLLNRRNSGESGPAAVNPRPLLFDLQTFDWRTPAERAENADPVNCQASRQFQSLGADATVTEQVVDNGTSGSLAQTKTVTVTINWSEGETPKSYVVTTLVAQNGIHIY